ncbi:MULTISPECIES: sodium/calcium exchanger membrane region [unclassified Hydrogenobaculum]|uniref:sodium:calcium antiporter n=1 Tax=unclassified Hydrogenobaculum TaxID=2622382 RepID=UPI0001C506A7|nr:MULTISPECIES: sodium/calcium exchanger membrane region [unclassified Hydrogenobaculum]AEF18520.1 sodium/calcium exchanger membrane region [Hydrogenobaculum sp. 3684]AEG45808.1 sodium/calcium exchanger membrane region [Hydrogenobaculum sp. SHO]AGG14450.1 sodium/calcium exchanger membrane region [Hydrogenobaculum sp. HO]AGH92754.1 Ca2+/Na+ antiporter [Hydrogenobaculum sp. SN]
MDFILIVVYMILIYVLAEIIVNAIDVLSHELKIPEGISSSVIASLVTTLPEFLVPLISFLKGSVDTTHIGLGSIFGGPMFLSMFGFGFMLLVIEAKYKRFKDLYDLTNILFFLFAFNIALLANFLSFKKPLVLLFLIIYAYFVYIQFKSRKTKDEEENEKLFFSIFFSKLGIKDYTKTLAVVQGLLVIFTLPFVIDGLVLSIEGIAHSLGWDAYKSAIVFSPLATELPELSNAFIWARKGRIKSSIGNIVGSLVFQSCMPVSLGLWFTDWRIPNMLMVGGFLSILSTLIFSLSISKAINLRIGIIFIIFIIVLYFLYIL